MEEELHFDAPLNFSNSNASSIKLEIDTDLYDYLFNTAKMLTAIVDLEADKMVEMREEIKNKSNTIDDLNKISEIYCYEGEFNQTSKAIHQSILYLSTVFGEQFSINNYRYLEAIIFSDETYKGGLALEFYLKIGKHASHRDHVLNMIKDNIMTLSYLKKKIVVVTLLEFYDNNDLVKDIIMNSDLNDFDLLYDDDTPTEEKPWWKFW
jgi:hypothetical protein